jgi:hypothetical protein
VRPAVRARQTSGAARHVRRRGRVGRRLTTGRRVVQISAAPAQLYALCSDGSTWLRDAHDGTWGRLPAIPRDPAHGDIISGGYVLQTPAAGGDAVRALDDALPDGAPQREGRCPWPPSRSPA